jgi:hypothetical protein
MDKGSYGKNSLPFTQVYSFHDICSVTFQHREYLVSGTQGMKSGVEFAVTVCIWILLPLCISQDATGIAEEQTNHTSQVPEN